MVAFQSQDFERHYAGNLIQPGQGQHRFLTVVFRDPVPLTTSILLTARHLLSPVGAPPGDLELHCVLQLEGFLLRSINAALRDPTRAVSTPLVVAVALLASYELKHGSLKSYHTHMRGLMTLINARGGLEQIGLQDPVSAQKPDRWGIVPSLTCSPACFSILNVSSSGLMQTPRAWLGVIRIVR